MAAKTGRNELCPCGSGKKFKRCCGATAPPKASADEATSEALKRAGALFEAREFQRALAIYRDILARRTSVEALVNAGACELQLARYGRAAEYFRQALPLAPEPGAAHYNLATALGLAGKLEESIEHFYRAIEHDPHFGQAYNNLANALRLLGRWREAARTYKAALDFGAHSEALHTGLLFSAHYSDIYTAREILGFHRDWARYYAHPTARTPGEHENARDPERPLRIGYVSPNFSRRIVGFFFRPLLEHHDAAQFEIYCYSNTRDEDDYTDWMRTHCAGWRDIRQLDDDAAAERVRRDGIDILVDLAGHAPRNRLGVFARKPAPVQFCMIDYFDTTGLDAVDYFVTDSCHSPESSEQLFVERLIHLPQPRLCYRAPDEAPPVAPAPCLRNGVLTFGSFNRRQKLTAEVIDLWCRVLAAVPDSRMLLKGAEFEREDIRKQLLEQFAAGGIEAQRIELRGASPHREMLAQYADVDIALDPFPYNGGLTTCEALWMGVPVVGLRGARIVSRQTACFVEAVGLPELAADDAEAYIGIASRLAADPERVQRLRSELRPRMAASPLCDGAGYAAAIESAYRHAWRAWCRPSVAVTLP